MPRWAGAAPWAIESKIDISIGDILVLKVVARKNTMKPRSSEVFQQKEVPINVVLNLGKSSATAWGCDLSKDYVTINSQYMT